MKKFYKGFNEDLTCRGFQYEEGKTYETDEAKLCSKGFHACENPLDCFGYYAPGESVYHEVEIEDNGDFKVACWADDSHISADLKDSNQKVANMDDLLVGSKYNVLNGEEKHHFDGFAIK